MNFSTSINAIISRESRCNGIKLFIICFILFVNLWSYTFSNCCLYLGLWLAQGIILWNSIWKLLQASRTTLSRKLFDIFRESFWQRKLQKDMIWTVWNRMAWRKRIKNISGGFWWHITLNWSEIQKIFCDFYWFKQSVQNFCSKLFPQKMHKVSLQT